MNNLNKSFWNEYYTATNDDIEKSSSFSNFVYSNYVEKYNSDNVCLKICDLGSGNCRDTLFFHNKGNMCYGIDVNGVLAKEFNNCKLIKKDVESVLKNYELRMLFDIMYMRWFLHALPYNISTNIFTNAVRNLKQNGLMCIEVRSINDIELKENSIYDEDDNSYATKHKRWLYSIDMCKKLAADNDCEILHCEEGYFSRNENTETVNPLLIRFVCRKRSLPYYEKSPNYDKFKHILPKMQHCTSHYHMIDKMNKILEKYQIKYTAVAGTSLGLKRQGGIIPWDNDIDIGFVSEEWKKLFEIKDLLEDNGFKYESNGKGHCHFGPIDCFELKLNKEQNTYEGCCGTYCTTEEYKNVVKQIFGYSYVYAPFCNHDSLVRKKKKKYFHEGNVNDNYHFKDKTVKVFDLNHNDLTYLLK